MTTSTATSTTTSTTAAVWRGGDLVTLESVPIPVLDPGEVLVRVSLATVCGSDLGVLPGGPAAPCPSVLGHEAVGVVTAVGQGASVAVGDRVVWSVTASCGSCSRCAAGRTADCATLRAFGRQAYDSDWPLSGAYAEHVLLPRGTAVALVPASVPDAVAAPAACATATVMAVLERAGSLAGARVLVMGAGLRGLTAVAAARDRGAASVLVVDADVSRLRSAARFGATYAALPGADLPAADVTFELPDAGPHDYEPHHLVEAVDFLSGSLDRWPWEDLVSDPVPLSEIGRLLSRPSREHLRDAVRP